MVSRNVQAEIQRFSDEVEIATEDFVQMLGQELTEEVIRATPVDTGFLRASWTAQINSPSQEPLKENPGAGGTPPVAEINMVFGSMQPGDVVYVTNGARYAAYLEYGTRRFAGHQGFVRNTVNRLPQFVQQTAQRIKDFQP